MAVYDDPGTAARYDRGRRLRVEDVGAWMAAARPFLPGGGGRILDVGAGTGRFAAALAGVSGASVVAGEPSAAMRAVFAGGALVGAAAEALPFRAGVFGAVWASQVLHHVGDLGAFAAEVRRVLSPGGFLLVRGGFGPVSELPLSEFFPGAWPGSLSLDTVGAAVAGAGLRQVAHVRVPQVFSASPAEFAGRVRSRTLSMLALLDDVSFAAGLRAVEERVAAGALPQVVTETLDLVVFRS